MVPLLPVLGVRRHPSTGGSSQHNRSSRQLQLHLQAKKAAPKKPLSQAKKAATQVTERHCSKACPSGQARAACGTSVLRPGPRLPAASLERKAGAVDSTGNRSDHRMLQGVITCCEASVPGHAKWAHAYKRAVSAARSNATCSLD